MADDEAEPAEEGTEVEANVRYSEYWEYMRQIERLRFQLTSVVVVISVAVLGFVADRTSVTDEVQATVLFGLGLIVFAALMFLVRHKASYKKYFDSAKALDDGLLRLKPGPADPFFWLLVIVSVLEAGIMSYLGLTVAALTKVGLGVLAGAILFVPAMWFSWREYLKNGRTSPWPLERPDGLS